MNKGLIKISNELYINQWSELYIFMKDFRPTHIEFRHWENNTWYIYGVSEMFDKAKEGNAVPEYFVIFNHYENKDSTYKFERI